MNTPCASLRKRSFIAVALIASVLAMAMGVHYWQRYLRQPRYDGKRLSEWLYPKAPDFIWIPNDLYGHIHDELWGRLVDPSGAPLWAQKGLGFEPGGIEPPQLDRRALRWLVRWMGAQPSRWERLRHQIARHLPTKIAAWVDQSALTIWGQSHTRWHVAAFRGLTLLGTNATPALPGLSNLLSHGEADITLTWAIENIGPEGMALLTNALTSTNSQLRDSAAFALGIHYAEARMALPALVGCVEHGGASYDVLGAIGRIGGEEPRLVPSLVTSLADTNRPPGVTFDETMAILVLGLEGNRARAAVPVLRSRYEAAAATGDKGNCKLLRRVLRNICPEENHLPPPAPGEEDPDWP